MVKSALDMNSNVCRKHAKNEQKMIKTRTEYSLNYFAKLMLL